MIKERLNDKVNELCAELLLENHIDSGDISVEQAVQMEIAEHKLAEVIEVWINERKNEGSQKIGIRKE